MKQVINITLNSIVFAIEQDAYDILGSYLEQIKVRLAGSDDQSEIMTDIESAIAEKFVALGRSEKFAVSLRDVEQMRTQMGAPEDFGEAAEEETKPSFDTAASDKPRRLFRDTDDAVVAGVASGIARYFSIDPVLVRIGFVASAFANGFGILAYLILWLVVPAAKTTAERYAMRGKRVTIEDIASSVKKNISESELADTEYARGVWYRIRNFLQQVFVLLGSALRVTLRVLRYVVGIGFVVGGAIGSAALVSMYSVVLLSDKTFLPIEAQEALAIMLGNAIGIIAIAASFVMALIPLFVLILLGASLLKKHNLFTTNKTITLVVVWIIALVLAGTTSALQVEKVWQEVGGDLGHEVELVIDEDGMRSIPYVEDPITELPSVPSVPTVPQPITEPVLCTMDAKQCANGSYVGRSGPDCAFAECVTVIE
mgnify:CR=1 FL=1